MDSSKSNGLEDALVKQQLQYIKNSVLKKLFDYDSSWPFRKPVDTVALNLHDYFEIIKQPMDLGTIKKKLNQKKYASAQACVDDFGLMFKNCYTYNRPTDEVITYCKNVENYFNQLIKHMPMEVNPSKRGRGRAPAATVSAAPKQVRKSNGSISASMPQGLEPPPVKNETKPKSASINSIAATVMPSKAPASVNNNQVDSKSSLTTSTTKVALANSFGSRSAAPTLETQSSTVEHSIASSSKIKKRKMEDDLPETKKLLKIKAKGDESSSLEAMKSLKRKADDKEIFDVRKSIKRKVSEELRPPSLEPSISGLTQSGIVVEQQQQRFASKQHKKETASEQMPDLTKARKLSSDALTYCYNVLLNMIKDQPDEPDASQLYKCVDPNTPGMENYYQVVKRPMDLVTVKKNLEGGVYTEIKQFAADVRQVFSNCYRYNVNNNKLVKIARDLQNFFEVRYARAPEENESTNALVGSAKRDEWSNHPPGGYPMSKRSQSTSSSSSDDTDCKKTADHDDEIELLQQQLLQAQERINALQSNTQPSVKKEKKPKQKPKLIDDDLCDGDPAAPVIQSISKPPPVLPVEEIPVSAAAAPAELLPKPAKPAKGKALSHKKAAQKPPVSNAVVAVADIPDPAPSAPQAASPDSDFRQNLKWLATHLPQLPEHTLFHCLRMIYGVQPEAIHEDSQKNLSIIVEKLNRTVCIEIRAYLEKYLEDREKPVSEKKSEQKKHPKTPPPEVVVEEDLKKKTGALDGSPVHPAGHLLPQQPMRPSNTAAPKPTPKVISSTPTSAFGSQVRQAEPEPISAPLPLLPPVASKPAAAAIQQNRKSSPLTESRKSISPKEGVLSEKKPVFAVAGPVVKTDPMASNARLAPPVVRPAPLPVTSARPASSSGKPSSSSPPASIPKKSTARTLSNSTEDSSSPKVSSRPGSSLDLASMPASSSSSSVGKTQQLLSSKSVPASVGPFGIDSSKPATPKEAVPKPSASSWSFLNLKANTKAPVPKVVPQQNVNASFNHYKELAKQRNASEKLQEREKERQKMESEERERKRREEQKAKDEEEALMRALNNSERTAQAAPAAVDSKPKESSAERQAKLKEQERLREQQRRRMEAQSNKIDMNFQSDLLASFEYTLKNPS